VDKLIRSDAVAATAKDSRNDAVSTAVVLLGAVISLLTNVNLDGWLGAVVALFIIISGVQLILDTADPLLGQAPEEELVEKIREKILSYDGIIGMHDLAVHNYGVGRCFASVHCEVSAEEDILESHDLIDNIERDFKTQDNITLVIHLDPVITSDPRTTEVKERVEALCRAIYPDASVHDFRVVWGVTHSNLVFDIAVPFSVKDSEGEVRTRMEEAVKAIDPQFRAVITVDRG
jgi:divalent metal cation (Fe/Co/Zn/Cd) transporter